MLYIDFGFESGLKISFADSIKEYSENWILNMKLYICSTRAFCFLQSFLSYLLCDVPIYLRGLLKYSNLKIKKNILATNTFSIYTKKLISFFLKTNKLMDITVLLNFVFIIPISNSCFFCLFVLANGPSPNKNNL